MPARRHANGAGEIPPCPAPSSDAAVTLATTIAGLADLDADRLRLQWRNHLGGAPPAHLPRGPPALAPLVAPGDEPRGALLLAAS